MRWSAVIMDLKKETGIVRPSHGEETIEIPVKLLPKDCRVGDILQFTVLFDPYSTLAAMDANHGGRG